MCFLIWRGSSRFCIIITVIIYHLSLSFRYYYYHIFAYLYLLPLLLLDCYRWVISRSRSLLLYTQYIYRWWICVSVPVPIYSQISFLLQIDSQIRSPLRFKFVTQFLIFEIYEIWNWKFFKGKFNYNRFSSPLHLKSNEPNWIDTWHAFYRKLKFQTIHSSIKFQLNFKWQWYTIFNLQFEYFILAWQRRQ